MDIWHSRFAEQTPLLWPLRGAARRVNGEVWPSLAALRRLVADAGIRTASGLPLRLTPPGNGGGTAIPYEVRIHERGELEFRQCNWHDLFNLLVWLTFPRAKAALNARHYAALTATGATAGRRGPLRDALTLFDESGVIVLSAEGGLLDLIREFRWLQLFWERRTAVIDGMRFLLFGHALCEKALAPYRGMTGHSLLLEVDRDFLGLPLRLQLEQVDDLVARRIAGPQALHHARELSPLPVLGVPGWHEGNESAGYYADRDHFRAGRMRGARVAGG